MNNLIPTNAQEPVAAYGIGQPPQEDLMTKITGLIPGVLIGVGVIILIDLLLTDDDKNEKTLFGKVKRAVTK